MAMSQVILFYDADCGFCQASADWLLRKSRTNTFQVVAYQDETEIKKYPMVDRTLADKGIQALDGDGKLWRKASATGFCLSLVPGWKWLGRFILCPLVLPFASIGYALVAGNRQRISKWMGRTACRIPGSKQE
jgi:predicted DCC family thiol-disulfide oxidoreductase YuxK